MAKTISDSTYSREDTNRSLSYDSKCGRLIDLMSFVLLLLLLVV